MCKNIQLNLLANKGIKSLRIYKIMFCLNTLGARIKYYLYFKNENESI